MSTVLLRFLKRVFLEKRGKGELDYYAVELLTNGLSDFGELFALSHEDDGVVGIGAGAKFEGVFFEQLFDFFLFEGKNCFFKFGAEMGFDGGDGDVFAFEPKGADVVRVEHEGKSGVAEGRVGVHGEVVGVGEGLVVEDGVAVEVEDFLEEGVVEGEIVVIDFGDDDFSDGEGDGAGVALVVDGVLEDFFGTVVDEEAYDLLFVDLVVVGGEVGGGLLVLWKGGVGDGLRLGAGW